MYWLPLDAPKWPFSPKITISKHIGNGQNVSVELISVHQCFIKCVNHKSVIYGSIDLKIVLWGFYTILHGW